MKKVVSKLCVLALLLEQILILLPTPVHALTTSNYAYRNVCPAYELAYAKTDGTLEHKECYGTYQEAKNIMDSLNGGDSDNLVILKLNDGVTEIIDAKYALLDINKGASSQNTNVLNSGDSSDGTVYTYINGNSSYGATDAAYLEINIDNYRVKMKIAGLTGWLKKEEGGYRNYKIVPLAWVKSATKYVVTDSSISHYMTKDIRNSDYAFYNTIGPKPTMLGPGTYYSYDGNYFYNDLKSLLQDEKEGTHNRSVNKDKAYYNYYMYLPHHSKTTYSGSDIDAYLNNYYDKTQGYNYTMLYGSGYAFYNIQENQGINALLMLSVARNESAEGRSKYATVRNNLFGHGAVDSNPDNATLYPSVRSAIYSHAVSYFLYGYAFASNWRFYGSHLGNKVMGANVKYASDPYWAEKAASYYYAFDLSNGLEDYNYYQIAVKSKSGTIYPRFEPSNNDSYRISTASVGEPFYNYGRNGAPVIVVDEVEGDTVDGNNHWYKIISDVNIDANHQFVPNSDNVKYNWDTNYVYVPASYFTIINDASRKDTTSITPYEEKDYTYETFASGGTPTPQVGKIKTNNTSLYTDSTLQNKSGRTWNKNQYVVVFEKAYDGSHQLKSYLVSATYKKGFKEWISPSSFTFEKMMIGKVRVYNGTYTNVRNIPSFSGDKLNTTTSGLANGTYVVVLNQTYAEGYNWVQVDYDGTLGWVVQKDNDQEIFLSTTTLSDNPPEIKASDRTVLVNSVFDPKAGVTATDPEDGNITDRIEVTDNQVNTSQKGKYPVTYKVTDNAGNTTTKTIQVTVQDITSKKGLFAYQEMKQVNKDTFEVAGFLAVAGENNPLGSGIKHYFILQNVKTNQEYRFNVANWEVNYPYEMTNIDDKQKYDYSGGWFKGNIDLSKVPQGDYIAYVEVESGLYKSRELYQNLVYGEMPRKATGNNNRGYLFQMNYYTKSRPLDISIRDAGLLGKDEPPTTDKMYNLFESISLTNNSLKIRGTSHNVGMDYGINKDVKRQIVLENIDTFARIQQEVGSITNGDYVVDLKVSDHKDKTRAWFDGSIDISSLEKGTYAIYISTCVDNMCDFGELKDLAYRTFDQKTVINGKTYTIQRVDSKRFRMELVVS